jgi:hypothetical protein
MLDPDMVRFFESTANPAALADEGVFSLDSRESGAAALAAQLKVSEPTVKRMFSRRTLTLERLEQVCAVLHIGLGPREFRPAVDAAKLRFGCLDGAYGPTLRARRQHGVGQVVFTLRIVVPNGAEPAMQVRPGGADSTDNRPMTRRNRPTAPP